MDRPWDTLNNDHGSERESSTRAPRPLCVRWLGKNNEFHIWSERDIIRRERARRWRKEPLSSRLLLLRRRGGDGGQLKNFYWILYILSRALSKASLFPSLFHLKVLSLSSERRQEISRESWNSINTKARTRLFLSQPPMFLHAYRLRSTSPAPSGCLFFSRPKSLMALLLQLSKGYGWRQFYDAAITTKQVKSRKKLLNKVQEYFKAKYCYLY